VTDAALLTKQALLTPAEMARVDAAAVAAGVPIAVLMERAGWAVARAVARHFAPCRALVLAGPGNNGGDGIVAARFLRRWGWPVAVAALGGWPIEWDGVRAAFSVAAVARAELVIDAVFGAGLARDVDAATLDVLRAARRRVAVDVPSGLDGATGQVRGGAAGAALTVTFHRLKPGHLLLPGRTLCGTTVLADIGMPAAADAAGQTRAWVNAPGLWRLPSPAADAHKYTRGMVTVLGGAAMTGAARLAAGAARRAGAGLVTIAAVAGGGDLYRTGEPGTIVSDAGLATLLEDRRREVWVCGPGLGAEAAAAALPALLAAGRLVLVDADALAACAGAPERLRGAAVLTPHTGEFARVFGPVGDDKSGAARRAAALTGAVVVLKGADTVIAAPDGRVAINDSAPPWLATAGSGDVLAGIISGLLAQGMATWDAACAGVWLHGRAGAHAGEGLIAEDLLAALPTAFRSFGERRIIFG